MTDRPEDSPRRIVFVNRFFYPDEAATSRMLSDLAFALAARGFHVEVVTSRQSYATGEAAYPSRETVGGVRVHRVWTTAYGRANLFKRSLDYLSFYLTATWKTATRLRAGDTVVAKTDPPMMSVPLALAARLRGARLVTWLQDVFPEIAEALGVKAVQGPAAAALKAVRTASIRAAGANVVLSDGMAERLRALGAPPERTHVVANWIDAQAVHPVPAAENALRRAWGLEDAFVVMHSGNLGRAHDVRTVLDAALRLRDRRDIRFVFVGGGHLYGELRRMAQSQGLANMLFQPYQRADRLAESLSVGDVHLSALAPELEGFLVPSKIYGIAAAGRPILHIGAADGEIAQLAREAGWGQGIQQGDPGALVRAVTALRDDPERRLEMGRAGRRLAEARFDRDLAADRWACVLSGDAPSRQAGEANSRDKQAPVADR